MKILTAGNRELIKRLHNNDRKLNGLHADIEAAGLFMLANREVDSVKLRSVLLCLKINNDLGRIGEQVLQILRSAETIFQQGVKNPPTPISISRCANLVQMMIANVLDSFAKSDARLAQLVILEDKLVNEEHNYITCSLIDEMVKNPRSISIALEFLLVAKAIERIGDHAKNIASHVILMAQPVKLHHTAIAEVEEQAV